MTEDDVPDVCISFNKHMRASYKYHVEMSEEEIAHYLLPRHNIVYSYLVRDPNTSEVTDFMSFYANNTQIIGHDVHKIVYSGYLYYTWAKNNDLERLELLVQDCLILSKQNGFDVVNMTEVMQFDHLKTKLNFHEADGWLNHYLFNWRAKCVPPSEVGIIML